VRVRACAHVRGHRSCTVSQSCAIAGTVKEAVTTYKSWNENRKRRAARLSNKQANLASKEGARTPRSGHAPTCANTRTHARSHTGAREREHSSAPSAATRTARNSSALGAAEEQSSSALFGGDGRAQNPPNSSERPNKLAGQVQPGGIQDDHPRPVAVQPWHGGRAPGATSIASEPPDSADEAGAAGASVGAHANVQPCVGACVYVREGACVQGSASWL
jgi:hypothetical protein